MEYNGPVEHAVVRYATDRAYGGPEEGGWWYDVGELEKVVLVTRDQKKAWAWCRRLNEARHVMRYEWVGYSVVELPRYELKPEMAKHVCHADWDPAPEDYELRWDIPTYYPETRPHYC